MENFFNWVMTPVPDDEVQVWLNINNVIPEKCELYFDFCISLIMIMRETFLGEEKISKETKITLTNEDNKKHFEWCWDKIIDSFEKENVTFNRRGDHFEYFSSFFGEIFYNQKNTAVRSSIEKFFEDLFDRDFPFTKSDLDLLTELYKLLDKNLNIEN
jgi:hypothetical protein